MFVAKSENDWQSKISKKIYLPGASEPPPKIIVLMDRGESGANRATTIVQVESAVNPKPVVDVGFTVFGSRSSLFALREGQKDNCMVSVSRAVRLKLLDYPPGCGACHEFIQYPQSVTNVSEGFSCAMQNLSFEDQLLIPRKGFLTKDQFRRYSYAYFSPNPSGFDVSAIFEIVVSEADSTNPNTLMVAVRAEWTVCQYAKDLRIGVYTRVEDKSGGETQHVHAHFTNAYDFSSLRGGPSTRKSVVAIDAPFRRVICDPDEREEASIANLHGVNF